MNAIERAELLEKAEDLLRSRDFPALEALVARTTEKDAELEFYLALALSHTGRGERALKIVEALSSRLRPYPGRLSLRALNLEGAILLERGEAVSAGEKFREVLSLGTNQDDPRFVAAASMNLGTIAVFQHQWARAIVELHRAMGVSGSIGLRHQVAGCHHNLGMVFREIGQFARSAGHFDQAKKLYAIWGTDEERLGTEIESALAAGIFGSAPLALRQIERAFTQAAHISSRRLQGEAHRVRGIIQLHLERVRLAVTDLENARQIGLEGEYRLLAAESSELLGRVAAHEGRTAEAAALTKAANEAYSSMNIMGGKADCWLPPRFRAASADRAG
jgi:hypothetical protein